MISPPKPVLAKVLPAFMDRWLHQWIGRRMPEKSSSVRLNIHSTYILPTRYGVLFGVILYGMLMSSINYSNSMGFLLTFLLAGICLTGMLHTFRNLINVEISAGKSPAVFAGETAFFNLWLATADQRSCYAFNAGSNRHTGTKTDIDGGEKQLLKIPLDTKQRGRMQLGRIRVWSEFPLGLFHVWSWVELDANLIVYPQPQGRKFSPALKPAGSGKLTANTEGYDDFAGLRRYQSGDSSRHIDWKAVARSHEIFTKQFADPAGGDVWLDWDMLAGMPPEQRLSQLCQWVLDLHRLNCNYGLKMPHYSLEPGHGEAHRHNCLTQLALFEY